MSNFYCMPAHIAENENIPMLHKMIYMYVFSYTNNGKACFYSNATLAKKVGVKVRQLQYGLAALQKLGLITVVIKNHQRFLLTVQHALVISESIPDPMHSSAPPPCTLVHPSMHSSAPIIDNIINKDNTTKGKSADALSPVIDLLKKHDIKSPKKLTAVHRTYIEKAKDLLMEKNITLDEYLEYLTTKCPRRLLPYIVNDKERQCGFGNILRPSFINDTLTGKWED